MINRLKILQDSRSFHYFLILLVSLLVTSPVLFAGVPYGTQDFIHHLQISNAFYNSLNQGIIYPNWVFQENSGYGAVTVRFYPPLVNYSLALFRIITGNWQLAIFAAFSFWSFVGGLGVYIWSRDFLKSGWQPVVAALLFIFAPYHLNQFYNSFMFGEFVALSLLPFCFYYSKKVCESENIADILSFSVSMAMVILSNLPQTIISVLALGLYILFNLKKQIIFRQISRLFVSGLLALSCSAFYWVRLVVEMNLINVSQPNTDPSYDYRNHFLLSDFSFDAHGIWFASLIFFLSVLTSLTALIISGKIKAIRHNENIKHICLIGLTAGFMMLPVSKFIWDNLVFLQKIQFPWRFLSILTIFTSVILAYCTEFITVENLRRKRPLILLLGGIILIFLTFSIKQVIFGAVFLENSRLTTLVEQSVSGQGLEHWLPTWAVKQAFKEKTKVSTNGREVNISVWENEKRVFSVAEGIPAKARVAVLYYPHWQAFINGKPADVFASGDGAINIDLPGEAVEIELLFIEPQYSLLSRKVSIIAGAALILLFIYQFLSRYKYKSS